MIPNLILAVAMATTAGAAPTPSPAPLRVSAHVDFKIVIPARVEASVDGEHVMFRSNTSRQQKFQVQEEQLANGKRYTFSLP